MINDDLDEFYSLDEFAIEAVTEGKTIVGIFDREYVLVGNTESKRPVFRTKEIEVTEDQLITINSKDYKIISTEPNGVGEVLLILQNA